MSRRKEENATSETVEINPSARDLETLAQLQNNKSLQSLASLVATARYAKRTGQPISGHRHSSSV